ncbi:MAG: hypothetical protein Q8Q89_02640 [bacterium]|nr:hypothetical protein [bacterium]
MKKAFIALVTVFVINIPSLYYGWYLKWDWVDIVFHFTGGLFVAMFMADYLKDHFVSREWVKNMLIVVGATVFIGVVWEFAEFIANQTLADLVYSKLGVRAYFIGDLQDTINDLLMDILGALTFMSLHFFKTKND